MNVDTCRILDYGRAGRYRFHSRFAPMSTLKSYILNTNEDRENGHEDYSQ